ncbi:hypothetical protein [Halofilum ochraceum]|uniref:hypothetical protein n=1 Tax=Halofilum ochraceum TaxID=1611323 RepID=UPI0008D9746D|nr:hypothetical protein [Halofilum ochraceum]
MALDWLRVGRTRSSASGFPDTPRALRRWLDAAERQEHRTLSQRLLEAARALNGMDLAPRERLRMLELMRPTARKGLDYLGGRIHAQALPLQVAARVAFDLDLELLDELTRGYEDALTREPAGLRRRTAALAAERALTLLGEQMLRVAQTYGTLDDGFHERVNRVYRRAEAADAAGHAVENDQLRFAARQRQSPETMFKRILLFDLAGVQGFRRGEARRLYRALEGWADLARLHGVDSDVDNSLPRFAVDTDSGEPPRLLEEAGSGPGVRILEVDDLVHHVEQQRIDRGPEDNPVPAENELGATALARLVDNWRPGNYQRSARTRRGVEVDAEATLNVIHARIAMELEPEEAEPDPVAETAGWSLEPIGEGSSGDAARLDGVRPGINWNEVSRGRDLSPSYVAAREEEARLVRSEAQNLAPRWLLADVSASGFRLIWDGSGSCRAAVGELVALKLTNRPDQRGRWCVGVVRRMRFLDERRFEIGVEALSRTTLPARVRAEPANRNVTRFRDSESSAPAVVLPADRARGLPTTVVVPAHMFREGQIIELDLHDRMLRLVLNNLREETGAFSRYTVTPAPERGRHAAGDTRFAEHS